MEENNETLKELHQKEQDEKSALKVEMKSLKVELNKEKMILIEKLEKLTKEKNISDERLEQAIEEISLLKKQLEEARVTQEKQLNDVRAKLEREYQNLMHEKEKLQSHLEAAKTHNRILLGENSRIKEGLQGTCIEISQLKEDIQKLERCYKQASQEFVQNFASLKQEMAEKVETNVTVIINKAKQDLSSVVCENAELVKKIHALLHKK